MSNNLNKNGPIIDAEAAVCEPLCETLPNSALPRGLEPAPTGELSPAGPDLAECFRDARQVLRSRSQRDGRGRFAAGNTEAGTSFTRSEQIWALVEPACQEIVKRVRSDLGLDSVAPEVMLGLVDNYAQLRMLRSSLWAQLVDRGGPVTAKGNSRRVYDAYLKASDRERDRANLLGLERRAKPVDVAAEFAALHREGGAQ